MEIQINIIYQSIKQIITLSRQRVYRMANSVLLETYWQIGEIIIKEEQKGQSKAEYGKSTLKNLAQLLTLEFGKGFDERNLNNMRAFYQSFPIWNALRTELSWTHYRLLSRLDSEQKRKYYLKESLTSNRKLELVINGYTYDFNMFDDNMGYDTPRARNQYRGAVVNITFTPGPGLPEITTDVTITDALFPDNLNWPMNASKGVYIGTYTWPPPGPDRPAWEQPYWTINSLTMP
jgi:hypothetical protein